jgi:uncharacterized protein (UPF0335 family)
MSYPSNEVNASQLRSFIERIEHIESEIIDRREDRKEIYAEAKGNGFDAKIIRKVVSIRKVDAAKRREEEEILDLYLEALGMLADTPLGQASIHAATAR